MKRWDPHPKAESESQGLTSAKGFREMKTSPPGAQKSLSPTSLNETSLTEKKVKDWWLRGSFRWWVGYNETV
jgi:hypothetical protein